jgi:Lrp/AsnC family transcriptional regulator, regulator for asnA, asnC and gidA
MLQQTRLDITDLRIMKLLSKDSRTPYRNIASAVGIMPSAAKERINKLLSNGAIRSFVLFVNPVILGYEKECILILRHVDKTSKEQDILNKVSLLGDVLAYVVSLEGTASFILSVKDRAQDKIEILTDLLKPAKLESIFARYSPVKMKIHRSDLKIMKCLLSDPRMLIEDIAEAISLSPKTVARRLEKLRKNHILQFSIITNLPSMKITGYIEFAVLINVKISSHQEIVEKIHYELQEYLLHIPHRYQKEVIFAVFSCSNISAVNLILRRLESYDGVNKVDPFITTSLAIYQDWLKSQIDNRISQEYLSSLAVSPKEA